MVASGFRRRDNDLVATVQGVEFFSTLSVACRRGLCSIFLRSGDCAAFFFNTFSVVRGLDDSGAVVLGREGVDALYKGKKGRINK